MFIDKHVTPLCHRPAGTLYPLEKKNKKSATPVEKNGLNLFPVEKNTSPLKTVVLVILSEYCSKSMLPRLSISQLEKFLAARAVFYNTMCPLPNS